MPGFSPAVCHALYRRRVDIVFLLFPRITALDAVGPYEVLSRLPGARARFVAAEPGEVRTDAGLSLIAAERRDDVESADVLVVPGGPGTRALVGDAGTDAWLRAIDATTTWTTSVCTGSLLLASAGLLDGVEATTHWAATDKLRELGAVPVDRRVVFAGKRVTAAGVSSGIDMALALAARIAGDDVARAIQLGIEYDPQPPFDSGSLARAPPEARRIAEAALGKSTG
jgi:transcriptional regulator GlxA family with amidase domain